MATTSPPRRRRSKAPAWKRYAAGTLVDHFAWWCEEFCVQSIDQFAGLPLVLEPWQVAYLGEALAVDGDGDPYWRAVHLVLPRKNGKSSMLAAYGLYHAEEDDGQPEVLLSASSDKQADRLFDYAAAFIRRSSHLSDRFHVRDYIGELARVDGGATVNRIASKPGSAHGANPSLVIVDELHAFTTPSLRKFWAAQITAGGARRNHQVFSITTAGEASERDTSILGQIIDGNERRGDVERPHAALTISRNHDARVLVYNYCAPTTSRHDIPAVKLANPASWITRDVLAKSAADPDLTDAEFLQLHAGVWADSIDAFITADQWDRLGGGGGVPDGVGAFIGMDGSYSYDTTVVAWAAWADDGRLDADARVFSARAQAPHHELCREGRIDFARVEQFTAELAIGQGSREAAFDPRYLGASAQRIDEATRGSLMVAAVEPQSKHMRDALATFHRLVVEGVVRHRSDEAIRAHVLAAQATKDDRGWVVSKRKHQKPIDAVPAMAMAVWRAAIARDVEVWAEVW